MSQPSAETMARYKRTHCEVINAISRKYRRNHPEKAKAYQDSYRATRDPNIQREQYRERRFRFGPFGVFARAQSSHQFKETTVTVLELSAPSFRWIDHNGVSHFEKWETAEQLAERLESEGIV